MPAAKFLLEIKQGATFRHSFELKQGEGASAPAVNLTGYAVTVQVRDKYGEKAVLLEFTEGNERLTITPAAGKIDLYASDADTALLAFKNGADAMLRLVAPNGDVDWVYGTAKLEEA